MFDSPTGQFIYCHNGIINEGFRHRVDSMIVGEILDAEAGLYGREYYYPEISHWDFANLIVLDTETDTLLIHKSYSGRLHHDGKGNWSTNRINGKYKAPLHDGWFALDGSTLLAYAPRPVVSYQYSFKQWYRDQGIIGHTDINEVIDAAYDCALHGESYCRDCGFPDTLNDSGLCDLCSRYVDACNSDDNVKENNNADSV
jgi:hypothetical protein